MALLPSVLSKTSSSLYDFSNFTFTNAGITGQTGPTLVQIQSSYSATSWTQSTSNLNMTTQGFQRWTVPASGNYTIELCGAQGGTKGALGNALGGRGAQMIGTFALNQSNVIQILVGQMGGNGQNQGGGGGGSFVVLSDNTPLIISGGGGGAEYYTHSIAVTYKPATTSTTGQSGTSAQTNTTVSSGGTAGGGGGTPAREASAAGGGGLSGNGTSGIIVAGYANAIGGISFVNGGRGGNSAQTTPGVAGAGGFGGGGGGEWLYNTGGGGGGGYSGGGGGTDFGVGGGGGSYNSGTNQLNTSQFRSGHGYVLITKV